MCWGICPNSPPEGSGVILVLQTGRFPARKVFKFVCGLHTREVRKDVPRVYLPFPHTLRKRRHQGFFSIILSKLTCYQVLRNQTLKSALIVLSTVEIARYFLCTCCLIANIEI